MARKENNIHYIYKTTCNITGRWYVGMHSTSNLEDGYMGSGKILRYSIRKHGVGNHSRKILEFFETRELLVEAEKKAITPEMITDKNCMNLAEGGSGGHGARFLSKEQLIKGRIATDIILLERYGKDFKRIISKNYRDSLTDNDKKELKLKIIEGQKLINFNYNTFSGKSHSEESKQFMSEKRKGTGTGETNSQYGTCWITKDGTNKKIKKEDLEIYLNEGWLKGRNKKN